jgi:hypothetical protein
VILSETACSLVELTQHGLFGAVGSKTAPPPSTLLLDGLWWIRSDYLPLIPGTVCTTLTVARAGVDKVR